MSDDFTSPTNISWHGSTGIVEYGGGDKGMVAMFYNRPVHNPAKSTESGRPVYEDVIYVRIHPPGERLNIIDRPASGSDSRRWPTQWQQFAQNKEQHPDGTPIDMLYPDFPSIAAMLRAHNCTTVEQCSELSAQAIENIGMGAQRYANDAKKYLEMSNKGVNAAQFRKEMEDKDRQIRVMERQINDLKDVVANLQNNNNQGAQLAQVQQLLAGMMGRPQHMPNQGFDSQSAMINSTHATADISRKPQRRSRAKLA